MLNSFKKEPKTIDNVIRQIQFGNTDFSFEEGCEKTAIQPVYFIFEQKATIAKKDRVFAIPIVDFAIADRTAIFWPNRDRRSRSDREK